MKMRLVLILVATSLTGCATQPQTYSWYHPEGGEYLFAYDKQDCDAIVSGMGLALSNNIEGPFFRCMHDRGYYLVDDDRIVQGPSIEPQPTPPVAANE